MINCLCALPAVLMTLVSIEWEAGNYVREQEVLQQSAEFCSDHPTWRLNLAHTILAQEGKLQVNGRQQRVGICSKGHLMHASKTDDS